jgi:hypothetical protein
MIKIDIKKIKCDKYFVTDEVEVLMYMYDLWCFW